MLKSNPSAQSNLETTPGLETAMVEGHTKENELKRKGDGYRNT
jgi:hypothetical protein